MRDMKAKILAERQNSCSCDSLERSHQGGGAGSLGKERPGPGSPRRPLSASGLLRQCDAGTVEVEVKPVPRISLDSDSGIDDFPRLEACTGPTDCHIPNRKEVNRNNSLFPDQKR